MRMKSYLKSLSIRFPFPLRLILLLGLIIRILFIWKGGAIYYGRTDFYVMGDTITWFESFLNLWKHGIYTTNLDIDNGKFFRPPGYSFILGIIYILCGQQTELMQIVLVWLQTILDVVAIYFVYIIAWQCYANLLFSRITSILYATYPFIIVWNPILYAESFSVFFLLLSFYYFTKNSTYSHLFKASFFLGLASLNRLQCLPFFGIFFIVLVYKTFNEKQILAKQIATLFVGFIVSYGLWPIRNYVFHNRIILMQDINIGGHWSPDFLSFSTYLQAIQVDDKPETDQLIKREKVSWPTLSYVDQKDSILLDSLTILCKTCGTGFRYRRFFHGFSNQLDTLEKNCDSTIASGFNYLTLKQKKNNSWHYYVIVPFDNLKKAVFKSTLYGGKSTLVKLISFLLFGYRSLLLLIGIGGIFIAFTFKKDALNLFALVSIYSAFWYFYMCFIFRHMEMRYMLHADILMLFPGGYFLTILYLHLKKEKNTSINKA